MPAPLVASARYWRPPSSALTAALNVAVVPPLTSVQAACPGSRVCQRIAGAGVPAVATVSVAVAVACSRSTVVWAGTVVKEGAVLW